MNDSGQAVGALVRRYRIETPEQVIVVQDELDLPPGDLKVKAGGGLAGHNGLRSINQHLKSTDFLRVRIGVGKPPTKEAGAGHVLSKVPKQERELLDIARRRRRRRRRADHHERSRRSDAAIQWQAMTGEATSEHKTAPLGSLPQFLRDEPGLTRALGDPTARLAVVEVARPISIAALAGLSSSRPLIVTCPTGTMAGQLADDLRQFLPPRGGAVPRLGDAAVRAGHPSVETMGQRLDVLWRLRDPERVPPVIVTGVRALPQKLGRERRPSSPVVVRPGIEIDPDELGDARRVRLPPRERSSIGASSPAVARSSTSIRRPRTCLSASTCGATKSIG